MLSCAPKWSRRRGGYGGSGLRAASGTALLFLSVNVTVAQDERPFLKTRRGTFTVEQINKDEKNTCIFKNGAKLYCAEEAYIDVRKTIKLRNYTVALFTANEGGSGTRWDKVGFLVVGPRKPSSKS